MPRPVRRVLLLGVFFFQAEDGIRDSSVTGVQTCALPICSKSAHERPTGMLCAMAAPGSSMTPYLRRENQLPIRYPSVCGGSSEIRAMTLSFPSDGRLYPSGTPGRSDVTPRPRRVDRKDLR